VRLILFVAPEEPAILIDVAFHESSYYWQLWLPTPLSTGDERWRRRVVQRIPTITYQLCHQDVLLSHYAWENVETIRN
jgi:hypothetical protein